jgi:hypothetical protein
MLRGSSAACCAPYAGWALCGHEAPAGFGGAGDGDGGASSSSDAEAESERPPRPAATTNGAAVPQPPAAAAATPDLCALQAEQGRGGGESSGVGDGGLESPVAPSSQGPAKRQHLEGGMLAAAGQPPAAEAAGEGPRRVAAAAGAAQERSQQEEEQQQQQAQQAQHGAGTWRPYHLLPRAERISVGQKCKRLIDQGRLLWLREQGFKASGAGAACTGACLRPGGHPCWWVEGRACRPCQKTAWRGLRPSAVRCDGSVLSVPAQHTLCASAWNLHGAAWLPALGLPRPKQGHPALVGLGGWALSCGCHWRRLRLWPMCHQKCLERTDCCSPPLRHPTRASR